MKTWQKFWVDGVLPLISETQKEAIKKALETNDRSLIQGKTVKSTDGFGKYSLPAGKCCAIAYTCWKPGMTVREVEQDFDDMCLKADELCGVPLAAGEFLIWWDAHPREYVFAELLKLMNTSGENDVVAGSLDEGHISSV